MVKVKVFGSDSSGNSYHLTDGDSSLLLDAGVNPKKMRIDYSTVDALLVTHEHGDHAKFIEPILKRAAFNVYCTKGTAQFIKAPSYRVMEIQSKQAFTVKGWQILPFDVQHDAAEPVGYLISSPNGHKILFATDTYYIKYRFAGITHMLIECNYSRERLQAVYDKGDINKTRYNRLLKSHFELSNVIQFLHANDLSQLQEVYLLHLSNSNSDAEHFKTEIQKATGVPVYIAGGDG